MTEKMIADLKKIAAFPLYFAVTLFYGGYVASELWGWFVVPLGVPDISYATAAGLMLFVRWATATVPGKDRAGPETWWGKLVFSASITTLVYLAGHLMSLLV